MGTSRLLRATWQKCQSPGGNKSENHSFSIYFPWIVGQNQSQNLRKTRPIILNRSQPPSTTPSLFYIDFTSLIFFWKSIFFTSCFEVFPIFSLFYELRRLWDHSQIVDLIFLIRMVSTRAHEPSKTPHSWQNNVPKRSTKYFLSISFFFVYYLLSLGGSGTTPKL